MERYIGELLYQHDCVILPEFGGFVGNYAPAKFNEERNLFSPPSKKIGFNKNLTHNDGLLTGHIARAEGLSFAAARDKVLAFAGELNQRLSSSGRATLAEIGLFYTDGEGNLHFEPETKVNYLMDAYGLPAFSPLIAKESAPAGRAVVPKEKMRYLPLAAAAALGALLTMTAILFYQGNFRDIRLNYSEIFPPLKKEAPRVEETGAGETLSAHAGKEERVVPPAPVTDEASAEKKYHVIVGCFKVRANAERLLKKLKKQGGGGTLISDPDAEGFHRVSAGDFATREEALPALEMARKNIIPSAWLFRKDTFAPPTS